MAGPVLQLLLLQALLLHGCDEGQLLLQQLLWRRRRLLEDWRTTAATGSLATAATACPPRSLVGSTRRECSSWELLPSGSLSCLLCRARCCS